MTPKDFCHWLQGYFEITASPHPLTPSQTRAIQKRLNEALKPPAPIYPFSKPMELENYRGSEGHYDPGFVTFPSGTTWATTVSDRAKDSPGPESPYEFGPEETGPPDEAA